MPSSKLIHHPAACPLLSSPVFSLLITCFSPLSAISSQAIFYNPISLLCSSLLQLTFIHSALLFSSLQLGCLSLYILLSISGSSSGPLCPPIQLTFLILHSSFQLSSLYSFRSFCPVNELTDTPNKIFARSRCDRARGPFTSAKSLT